MDQRGIGSPHICPTCGKTFIADRRQRYCSHVCKVYAYQPQTPQIAVFCHTCGLEFLGRKNTRYCSKACWPSSPRQSLYHSPVVLPLPTSTVGAIAELAICQDLLCKGYAVFRAASPACYCDVLAHKFEAVWHIEVRTGYIRNGKIYCVKKYQEGVNCLGLWNKETNLVSYYAPATWQPINL